MIVGNDVRVSPLVNITRPALVKIGNHVALDFGFSCTTQLEVGDYVHISPHVSVVGGKNARLALYGFNFLSTGTRIIAGSDNMLGDGIVGPFIPDFAQDSKDFRPVVLEMFAGTGANSVVMPGVVMAEGSVLGANSLLRESTEPWTIYAGSPARPIKERPKDKILDYAEKLGYLNV